MNGLMVVDDEEGVRRSLKRVLERDGYRIILAENGEEALNIVRSDSRDIETVISDYRMPGIDGLETLIEIGRLNAEITRIMLTGYATMASAIEAVNAGIDGFLTKPFANEELRAKVREYMIKKRLKQFVSEQVLTELQKNARTILPKRMHVTVLFSDIRGFSALSERLSPGELSDLLNRHYFSPLDNIIFAHNGTLDKHIGDSVMGIFGAPVGGDDDALRAVCAALAILEEIARINGNIGGLGAKDCRRNRNRIGRGDGGCFRFLAEEGIHRLRTAGQPGFPSGGARPGGSDPRLRRDSAPRGQISCTWKKWKHRCSADLPVPTRCTAFSGEKRK